MRSATFLHILLLFTLFTGGCGGHDYMVKASEDFTALRPSTIAVLPVMNETVDLDAPKVFPQYIKTALLARGYRVTDQKLVDDLLNKNGIKEAGQLGALQENTLGEDLNAQALLYTTVTAWEKVFLGIYSSITVGARFDLIDSKTDELIWKAEGEDGTNSLSSDDFFTMSGPAFALFKNYEPYAKRLVYRLLEKMPEGPFETSELPEVKIKSVLNPENYNKN